MSTGGTDRGPTAAPTAQGVPRPAPPPLPPPTAPPLVPTSASQQPARPTPVADLSCPRCGYDQTGLAESMVAQCERHEIDAWPIRSTCAECGYEFDWSDLYNAAARADGVFFETWRFRPARAFRTTVMRMPRAGRFWGWTRMEWPIRVDRMLLATLGASVLWGGAIGLALPLVFFLLHMLQQVVAGMLAGGLRNLAQYIGWNTRALTEAFWVGVPWDDRRDQWPNITVWAMVSCGAVLLTPLVFRLLPQTLRKAKVRSEHFVRVWCYIIPRLLITVMLATALPRLLGQCVQLYYWIHNFVSVESVAGTWWFWIDRVVVRDSRDVILVAAVLFFAWRWWWCACRDYLKLPHAHAVAAAMLAITFLACWILALINPSTSAAATFIE